MAYCVLDNEKIHLWDVVSLLPIGAKIDLIQIGRNIQMELDNILTQFDTIDGALIENQIAPKASNMKSIQAMLAQYFIMRDIPEIMFISASCKLKSICPQKTTYRERKKLGINFCIKRLNDVDTENAKWALQHFLSHKKKDDLADAFLQAISQITFCGIYK